MIKKGTKIELVKTGIMMGRMKNGKEKWKIIKVYAEKNRLEKS